MRTLRDVFSRGLAASVVLFLITGCGTGGSFGQTNVPADTPVASAPPEFQPPADAIFVNHYDGVGQ